MRIIYKAAAMLAVLILIAGCAKRADDSTVIATVNGDQITLKELKRELAIRAKQNPSVETDEKLLDSLTDSLIKRRLIIQEAMKRDLANEAKFVEAIKAFWEQTLIKNFIEYKNAELERYIYVTDQDIAGYYEGLSAKEGIAAPLEEMKSEIREELKQEKINEAFESWLELEKNRASVHIDRKTILRQARQ